MTIKVKNIDTSTIDGKIAVMQAYKNGAKIALLEKCIPEIGWRRAVSPGWSWPECDYAVIEEPAEVWVVLGEVDGRPISITPVDSKGKAEAWASAWNNLNNRERYRAVKLREVQE